MARSCIAILAVTLAAGATHGATAQNSLPVGRWRGVIQQTGQDSIRVTFAVQKSGKNILITMSGRSGITYDMSGVKLKADVLTFDWYMGLNSFLYCRLSRRDGRSFEGICNDRSPGTTGPVRVWMMMTPTDSTSS